jgi:hypothetical protein
MPDPFERHARSKWDWGAAGARSQERAGAVYDDPARARTPGRKDPSLCKAAHWKGPHQPQIRERQDGYHARECRWDAAWTRDEPVWFCCHEEACTGCGKILRSRILRDECPDFQPITKEQHDAITAWIARRRDELAATRARSRRQPKPPITGPQGYRKRRSA